MQPRTHQTAWARRAEQPQQAGIRDDGLGVRKVEYCSLQGMAAAGAVQCRLAAPVKTRSKNRGVRAFTPGR